MRRDYHQREKRRRSPRHGLTDDSKEPRCMNLIQSKRAYGEGKWENKEERNERGGDRRGTDRRDTLCMIISTRSLHIFLCVSQDNDV